MKCAMRPHGYSIRTKDTAQNGRHGPNVPWTPSRNCQQLPSATTMPSNTSTRISVTCAMPSEFEFSDFPLISVDIFEHRAVENNSLVKSLQFFFYIQSRLPFEIQEGREHSVQLLPWFDQHFSEQEAKRWNGIGARSKSFRIRQLCERDLQDDQKAGCFSRWRDAAAQHTVCRPESRGEREVLARRSSQKEPKHIPVGWFKVATWRLTTYFLL